MVAIGDFYEGKVTGITSFGAFVQLPDNTSGMVHISEVSDHYVKDIKEVLKVDDVVKVKVTAIDEKGKIGLSIKQAMEKPKKTYSKPEEKTPSSFDDMLSKFMKDSEQKIAEYKRNTDAKRGGRGTYRG